MTDGRNVPGTNGRFGLDAGSFRRWPISAPGLHALKDLGLSDDTIAAYFGIARDDVADLVQSYEPN